MAFRWCTMWSWWRQCRRESLHRAQAWALLKRPLPHRALHAPTGSDIAGKTALKQRLEVQESALCEMSICDYLDDSLMVDRTASDSETGFGGSGSMGKTISHESQLAAF
ncbi:TPA: hypothetical protein ACH3X2_010920 [Trebouxia sp. C0005]